MPGPITVQTGEPDPTSIPTPVEEVKATPKTPVFALKAKRQEIRDGLYKDLKVPRWEGDFNVWVRYGPIDATLAEASREKREGSKKVVKEWQVLANADLLVNSCEGVYATHADFPEKKFSLKTGAPEGPWTKFDADLAENLGIHFLTAVGVCQSLYQTDGDLVAATNQLIEWSTKISEDSDADF